MARLTIRFPDALDEWIESQASGDRSKADVVRNAVRQARDRGDTDGDDLRDRVDDLERRVRDLESRGDGPVTTGDTGGDKPVTSGDERHGTDRLEPVTDSVTGGDTAGDDPVTSGDTDGVREVVERVADGWDDTDERLAARKRAATAVLEHARTADEPVGKKDVEPFYDELPVEGQNFETWWRKNVRPVLSEVGEYSRGAKGYRVDQL